MTRASLKRKTASKYHLVNNFNEMTHHLVDMTQEYNKKLAVPTIAATTEAIGLIRKYPKKAIEKISDSGWTWADDIQADLRQRINRSVDDGREFVRDLACHPCRVIAHYVEDGKAWIGDVFDKTTDIVENIADDGKLFVDEVRSDPQAMVNGIVQTGKKYIDRLPGMQIFEKQVVEKKRVIAKMLNLPTKDDLKKLSKAIEKLNKKIGHVNNQIDG